MGNIEDLQGVVLFAIGRRPVTLGGVVTGLAIILIGFLAARVARLGIERLRGRARHGKAALYIVEKLTTYGVVIAAVVIGVTAIGINLSSVAVFAGALGVGVGLGLQGIVKEFVSGLVLIFDRVLNVGDYVELEDGKRGLVQEIGPRAVRIRTNDNVDLVVPNSKFIEGQVVNWTLNNRSRRIHIPFRVAYGVDREQVRRLVLEAARSVHFTLPETETERSQVWLTGFGEHGLEFELLVWPTLDAVKRPAAMHAAYTWAIADALECAGVEIPYAQMDLRLRSLFGQEGDAALDALRLEHARSPRTPATSAAQATTNDAAEDLARPLPPPDEPLMEPRRTGNPAP
ncbi:mechanosensitive ion channel family protein [Phenylobacterium sp. J367]|uniref:mechanosensitive ion channel family protein n=1 Tax=Phenylobacterium sp. J367 TaxID=2898435 RepID=UPI002151BFD9|nr:mechanosensitive ion channel domain-containing protein [Phenylobacterium sp. J367]MCR5880582.1 mechanosensitive ion channel [Phenylobacterium sp. J367]